MLAHLPKTPANRGILGLLAVYAFYAFLKNRGWLSKKSVSGQHILITGGGSGIGRGMANIFAKLGAKITIVDLNEQAVFDVRDRITGLSQTC